MPSYRNQSFDWLNDFYMSATLAFNGLNSQINSDVLTFFRNDIRRSKFSSYKIKLRNRVTQIDVTLRVTDSKSFHRELLTRSQKNKKFNFELLTQS